MWLSSSLASAQQRPSAVSEATAHHV